MKAAIKRRTDERTRFSTEQMRQRIDHIDGLRGIAVLSVVLFHAGVYTVSPIHNTLITIALRDGCHGVDLFFILSGFCLAYPVLARLAEGSDNSFSLVSYAARRIVRIVPPYYASIAVLGLAVFILSLARVPIGNAIDVTALSLGGIVKQMLFLDGDRHFLNSSFWTLAVEFRWYFLFPVLLFVWTRSKKAFAAIAIAALIGEATQLGDVDLFFLPAFMLGIVAAYIYLRGTRIAAVAAVALPATLAVAIISTWHTGWYFDDKGPFWPFSMFWLVVAVGSWAPVRQLASSKWLVSIGSASYGIYLVHTPIVAFIELHAEVLLGARGSFVAAIVAAVALGGIFSVVAERPFVNSRLRARIVARAEAAISRLFGHLDIPTSITFARRPMSAHEMVLGRKAPALAQEERVPC